MPAVATHKKARTERKPATRRPVGTAKALLSACLLSTLLALPGPVAAQAETGATGLPLPRFVSLKAGRANMRVGPGRDYQVDWTFTRRGLPLEVVQEFDNWRKVRDSEGSEGWILHTLLSGNRTALVKPWEKQHGKTVTLHNTPSASARAIARIEPGSLAAVNECEKGWCQIGVGEFNGYVKQAQLWGVYPDESFD